MKKLSIEEKAKAYDEVREKIAIRFGSNVADEIFSQFEMSEDERIRKEIISALKFANVKGVYDKHIAWLETQGDKDRPTYSTYSKDFQLTQEEYDKRRVSDEATIKEVEAYKKGLEDARKIFEKQGEQKPKRMVSAEAKEAMYDKPAWNEEDVSLCARIQGILSVCKSHSLLSPDLYKEMCDWLKSLKERMQPQPKQEWSEEDENYHRICLDLCTGMPNGGVYAPYIKDEAINWLKSLKNKVLPQPKTEWSEEDRLHYANVLEALEYVKGCKYDYDKIEAVKSDIVWFKSLRPHNHWKPSEEQMEILWCTTERYLESEDKTTRDLNGKILESLYNDLKKLRGE